MTDAYTWKVMKRKYQLLHLLLPWCLHCRGRCPPSPSRCRSLQRHPSPLSTGYVTILSQQKPVRWPRIALSCLPQRPLLTKRRTVIGDGSNVCPCTRPPPSLRPYCDSTHAACGGIDRWWILPCFPPRVLVAVDQQVHPLPFVRMVKLTC